MGKSHANRSMCRSFGALVQLSAMLMWPLVLVASPIAEGGAAPDSLVATSQTTTVSRLVVRFRPGVHPAPGEVLGDPLLAKLQFALGRQVGVAAPTRAGDQILTLADPVSAVEAKRLVNILRMQPGVLWAELDRSEHAGSTARKAAAATPDDGAVVRRFIVTFTDPATGDLARQNQRLGEEWDRLLSAGAGVSMRVLRPTVGGAWIVEMPSAVSRSRAEELTAKLESTPGIRNAAPDYPATNHSYFPNDAYFQDGHQRDMADPLTTSYYGIDAPAAWDITVGSELVVAVVDTGVRPHGEFSSRLLDGYDFISDPASSHDGLGRHASGIDPGNWTDADECGAGKAATDSDWHGTHVSGIIAATGDNSEGIAGINWYASILPVRVLGTCGGYSSDILEGMAWAAGLPVPGVPDNPTPAKVINMSLGGKGPCDDHYQSVVDAVLARGTFIAVSAGNDSVDIESQHPANCYGLSTVAATDPYGYLASYSNYSVSVDIAAPGGDQSRYGKVYGIWSTLNSGATVPEYSTYGAYNGTSQAAPHVSGVASLMLSVNPALTPAQIKTIMADTSSYFAPTSTCRTTEACGAGIVNAYYAVKESLRLANQTTASVIEFYNAARDHYFISSLQPDIDALDSGKFPGWSRTGQSFDGYAVATAGANPVCRFYIPPPGDSHYFSASPEECAAVQTLFPMFTYEAPAVFYINLPDLNTGACPAGTLPVYRLWNKRADTNHRYTTSTMIRNQMLAKGYVSEGYGPSSVSMCAPQ
ncbi:MAG: S8 family serine peptidase [Betaproteobacteria bacterium]